MLDDVQKYINLYLEHWNRDQSCVNAFVQHLLHTDVQRSIITHTLTEGEEFALRQLKRHTIAILHKASNVFYKENSNLFEGRKVLEIGSGRHIDKLLVELSNEYHGVDSQYQGLLMERVMSQENSILDVITFPITYPIKALKKRREQQLEERGLKDEFAYDFRELRDSFTFRGGTDSPFEFPVYEIESGAIKLLASDYRKVPQCYDVVINGGARIEEEDYSKVKDLLVPNGIFISIAPPDMPLFTGSPENRILNEQQEIWVELRGKKESSVYTVFIATNN